MILYPPYHPMFARLFQGEIQRRDAEAHARLARTDAGQALLVLAEGVQLQRFPNPFLVCPGQGTLRAKAALAEMEWRTYPSRDRGAPVLGYDPLTPEHVEWTHWCQDTLREEFLHSIAQRIVRESAFLKEALKQKWPTYLQKVLYDYEVRRHIAYLVGEETEYNRNGSLAVWNLANHLFLDNHPHSVHQTIGSWYKMGAHRTRRMAFFTELFTVEYRQRVQWAVFCKEPDRWIGYGRAPG